MKKITILLIIPFLLLASIISCNKDKQTSSPVVRTERSALLGDLTPYRVDVTNNDVTVGFLQSARLFTLSLDSGKNKEYLRRLQSALEKDVPVSVSVAEGASEITAVLQASDLAVQKYQSVKQRTPVTTGSPSVIPAIPVIPNLAILNGLFRACDLPSIPFQYAADGCYARAHKMRQIILANGYDCYKLFAYGDLSANTGTCCVRWGYHVAPVVSYRDAAGNIQSMVIDPSLFSGPVDQQTWKNKCTDRNCNANTNISSESLQPGNIYFWAPDGTISYDDNYNKTNCTLTSYSGLAGCGAVGNNLGCW